MAIFVDVSQGQRFRRLQRLPRRGGTSCETAAPVAVVNVEPPTLESDDHVDVAVVIYIADEHVSSRHDRSRPGLGQCLVQSPVSGSVSIVDLEAGFLISEHEQVEKAITVEVGEFGSDPAVTGAQNLFGEASLPVAEKRL